MCPTILCACAAGGLHERPLTALTAFNYIKLHIHLIKRTLNMKAYIYDNSKKTYRFPAMERFPVNS